MNCQGTKLPLVYQAATYLTTSDVNAFHDETKASSWHGNIQDELVMITNAKM